MGVREEALNSQVGDRTCLGDVTNQLLVLASWAHEQSRHSGGLDATHGLVWSPPLLRAVLTNSRGQSRAPRIDPSPEGQACHHWGQVDFIDQTARGASGEGQPPGEPGNRGEYTFLGREEGDPKSGRI